MASLNFEKHSNLVFLKLSDFKHFRTQNTGFLSNRVEKETVRKESASFTFQIKNVNDGWNKTANTLNVSIFLKCFDVSLKYARLGTQKRVGATSWLFYYTYGFLRSKLKDIIR